MKRKSITALICALVYMSAICLTLLCHNTMEVMADEGDYMIKVNMAMNCITIYEKSGTGEYTAPVKSMACSVFEGEITEHAEYNIINKEEWRKTEDGLFSHYVVLINDNIFIGSSPYTAQSANSLDREKYNIIGEGKTLGNIWVNAADAKWLYENCANGAIVQLYNDSNNAGPLGKPDNIKIGDSAEYLNWDPTDDNVDNPWHNSSARIEGAVDKQIFEGENINLLDGVKGYDICGNDISDSIIIMGTYDFNKEGEYAITYYLQDPSGSQVNQSVNLIVKKHMQTGSSGEIESGTNVRVNEKIVEKSTGDKVEILLGIGVIALLIAMIIIKKSGTVK